MKIKSRMIDGNIFFDNFAVIKEGENFYGVYHKWSKNYDTYNRNYLITSGKTRSQACKKAHMLQIGYDLACDDISYNEMYGN